MSPPPARGRIVAVAALLLVSGAAALLHESAWFRMLVPVLGAGALPSAVVAAGALLGIGAGSVLGGRLADRAARPARVLALGEIAAAAMGLLVPPALRLLESFQGTTALLAATLLLALAAVPWGVSIPAAVRTIAAPADRIGGVFGRLYAWNTVGAVLGIAASAVWLFEALGNRGTVTVAAGLQALAALAALALATGPVAPAEPEAPAADADPHQARTPVALVLAAALAGIAGIGMQVAWMRRLTPILGATFPVFAAVLAIHLAGIALGSALLGPRRGTRPVAWIVTLAVVACIATAGTPLVLDSVADFARRHWWSAERSPASLLLVDAGVAAVLVLPGVLAGSALLPWLVRLRAPDAAHGGRGSGALLAANTAGGAAGGLAVALCCIACIAMAPRLNCPALPRN